MTRLITDAGPNPGQLEFPTDKWGFTSAIKKEVLRVASTVNGQDDKHVLLVGTLQVLLAHVMARLPVDKEHRVQRTARLKAFEAERLPRERTSGAIKERTDV